MTIFETIASKHQLERQFFGFCFKPFLVASFFLAVFYFMRRMQQKTMHRVEL